MSKKSDRPNVVKAKAEANHLHSLLTPRLPDISLGEVLNIYARMNGSKDWNALSAKLDGEHAPPGRPTIVMEVGEGAPSLMPVAPPEIMTANDMASFLSELTLDIKCKRHIGNRDPDDYMTWFYIDITIPDEENEDNYLLIGRAKAAFINIESARADGEDILDIFDAHSQQMEGLFHNLYDFDSYKNHQVEFTAPIADVTDLPFGVSFLYIDNISLDQGFQGMEIEKVVLVAIIEELANDGGLVVIDSGETVTLSDPGGKEEYLKYWNTLGFEKLADDNYMFFVLNYVMPSTKQVINNIAARVNNKAATIKQTSLSQGMEIRGRSKKGSKVIPFRRR